MIKRAVEMGITTWSTPWTPPALWKNNSVCEMRNKEKRREEKKQKSEKAKEGIERSKEKEKGERKKGKKGEGKSGRVIGVLITILGPQQRWILASRVLPQLR